MKQLMMTVFIPFLWMADHCLPLRFLKYMLLCMNVSDADQVYKRFLMLFDSSTEAPNIPVHTHTDTGQQVLANQSQTVRFWTALAKATMDTGHMFSTPTQACSIHQPITSCEVLDSASQSHNGHRTGTCFQHRRRPAGLTNQ